MYLNEILAAQKHDEARGITSVCSAHPYVLKETLKVSKTFRVFPLVEATCNQVNQFGGYTGMTPKDFVAYVRSISDEVNFPFADILLGGDHLGPNVWQNEPAESAMQKSEELIRDYVQAGFTKIHLDCSMRLADDPQGVLDVQLTAKRTARLAAIAEQFDNQNLRYIIGTEVPVPGGAVGHEEGVSVTKIEDVQQTIEVTREAFLRAGLTGAWTRVVGVVVQPGVEFGDDFVIPYQPEAARELSRFIESHSLVYEAHSTDYQTRTALKNLVRDHFAILKVGPALTFAFRDAIFALAMIESELVTKAESSHIVQVLEDVMTKYPQHWLKYYYGTEEQLAFKRKFSLSDRMRYYWVRPEVQAALKKLFENLAKNTIPLALMRLYAPLERRGLTEKDAPFTSEGIISERISTTLMDYFSACSDLIQK